MTDRTKRYPFSTSDGKSIPLDIIRPYGVISLAIGTGADTTSITIPDEIEVITFLSTRQCLVQFASSAASCAALVNETLKTDAIVISAGIVTVVSPPIGKKAFSILSMLDSGVCIVQYLETWSGLALASQATRR